MTNISSTLAGQYYQLPGQAAAQTVPTAEATDTTAVQPAANPSLSAYLLDLSPEAQNYLSNYGGNSGGATTGTQSFVLTDKQQDQISAILAKYKDAPQTQETYNKIQDDLKAAGLSPDQLATQDKLKSFNATQVLIDALSGTQSHTSTLDGTSDSAEQGKSKAYVQSILKQWQSLSTVAAPADTAA